MHAYTPVSGCVHFTHTFYFALFITHLYTLYLLIHALIYCIYLTIGTVYTRSIYTYLHIWLHFYLT